MIFVTFCLLNFLSSLQRGADPWKFQSGWTNDGTIYGANFVGFGATVSELEKIKHQLQPKNTKKLPLLQLITKKLSLHSRFPLSLLVENLITNISRQNWALSDKPFSFYWQNIGNTVGIWCGIARIKRARGSRSRDIFSDPTDRVRVYGWNRAYMVFNVLWIKTEWLIRWR